MLPRHDGHSDAGGRRRPSCDPADRPVWRRLSPEGTGRHADDDERSKSSGHVNEVVTSTTSVGGCRCQSFGDLLWLDVWSGNQVESAGALVGAGCAAEPDVAVRANNEDALTRQPAPGRLVTHCDAGPRPGLVRCGCRTPRRDRRRSIGTVDSFDALAGDHQCPYQAECVSVPTPTAGTTSTTPKWPPSRECNGQSRAPPRARSRASAPPVDSRRVARQHPWVEPRRGRPPRTPRRW
jgi:hypothetical protein